MLNIDETQLKLLLEKKRKQLEKPKYDGIGEIISSISLFITLSLADFGNLKLIKPLYFKIIAWGIAIIVLLYGLYKIIKSIAGAYSVYKLYSEIADIDPKIEHPFSIIVIRNNSESGKYLLFKSKRWKCWLFPNYHCSNDIFNKAEEVRYIKGCLKRDLDISNEFDLKYIGNEISEKYSVGDQMQKKYNFHFFQAVDITINNNNKRPFRYNGKKYCWKTLDQMYSNKNMRRKNKDVLDYIRRMCDIS